jgi:hypothetical protein
MQHKYLKILRENYAQKLSLVELPLLPYEVKGVKRITQVAEILFPREN